MMKLKVYSQISHHFNRVEKGYSLVEIIITMGLVSLLMAGVMTFFINNAKSQFDTSHRLEINTDIRNFTQELIKDARSTNSYFIYKSSKKKDRENYSHRKRHGETGNLLVLMHHELFPNIFHVYSSGKSLYGTTSLEMRLFKVIMIYKNY